jgi:hypothetical protein
MMTTIQAIASILFCVALALWAFTMGAYWAGRGEK